ncbi:MAG: hypothetical protein ACI3W5_03905 [Faecousia sp.]
MLLRNCGESVPLERADVGIGPYRLGCNPIVGASIARPLTALRFLRWWVWGFGPVKTGPYSGAVAYQPFVGAGLDPPVWCGGNGTAHGPFPTGTNLVRC